MPTYDYHCQKCGATTEAFQKITDAPLTTCPKCQAEALRRGPGGGVGLQFQGEGFYITDYGPKKASKCKSDDSKGGCCPCKNNPPKLPSN